MKKLWRVFVYEYTRHVLRKRFIFALLSIPLAVVAMAAIGFIAVIFMFNSKPIGYIDHSGLLAALPEDEETPAFFRSSEIIPFNDESTARASLEAGEIQVYFIVPGDYLETGQVEMVAVNSPGQTVTGDFVDFLSANLLAGQSELVAERVDKGPTVTIRSVEGDRQTGPGQILNMVIPLVAGLLFMISVNISGGYLVNALIEEKENRTMEIVVTSVSPTQLMVGKVLGDICIGLTQLVVWLSGAFVGVIALTILVPSVGVLDLKVGDMLLVIFTTLPAFLLVAALMATAGAVATESREAQQVAGLFTLPIFVPYWIITPLIMSPNSPLAVAFSLIPFTAPVTLPLRAAFTTVPAWQIGLSLGLLYLSAAGALWLAGRAFRMGMLRYGKHLTWREIFTRG